MEGKVEHLSRLDRSKCVPVFAGQINSGVSKCRPQSNCVFCPPRIYLVGQKIQLGRGPRELGLDTPARSECFLY